MVSGPCHVLDWAFVATVRAFAVCLLRKGTFWVLSIQLSDGASSKNHPALPGSDLKLGTHATALTLARECHLDQDQLSQGALDHTTRPLRFLQQTGCVILLHRRWQTCLLREMASSLLIWHTA